ncbi:Phycocyanobilin lyase subunit beta [Porphyridium purpureum]|uniref:Phycocyanobilin lyase subunit beta n=1 Tax=Porphyridium purpureum TaxID=35688 RepID=A0A5J4Z101_PORPP|nr:Phycocyanobilin lyase subunit beta [Porphyridium purpureum]|eukprot:POR4669..scf208_2
MMSGVNGGIDYEIDLSSLPEDVARRVEYVQGGPDSPTALIDAAHAIAACRISSTLPVMVDMLGFNNPIAANIAIDALVRGGKDSVEFLLKGVGAFNYAVNAYALRALGRIGDPAVVDVCMECARGGPIPNVRRAACNALGQLLYNDQADCTGAVELLLLLLQDPDWSVRYASVSALHQFKQWQMIEDVIPSIRARLEQVASQDSDRAVKARAHVALERYAT